MTGLPLRRLAALIAVPVVVIACAVFATATIERDRALHAYQQEAAGQRLLVAMLDEETGSRGYFETRQARFLAPWYRGQADFAAALGTSRRLAAGDAPLQKSLSEQAGQNAGWLTTVKGDIQLLRLTGRRPTVSDEVGQKALVDNFRALNQLFALQLISRRDRSLSLATWLAVGDAAALSILLVLTGLLIVRRTGQREGVRRRGQQELRELLQVSASEKESQGLLIRHVERVVAGSGAAVFNRNNSDDRLEVALSEKAELTPLRNLNVVQLRPRSCLAVRLSRAYERRPGDDSLMRCEACGQVAGAVLCEPLLVGGQVIGSVLVTRERAIGPAERARVHDSVSQAAPIFANQRNLALAERRAASDALTGLPNRRAADESIKRMVAHAGRTVSSIGAVLLDLDHFKQVNDLHGHDCGDQALATIGQILSASLRTSDFAARFGGEEFLLLLPDTDRSGAVEVAEKLRRTIAQTEVRDVGALTASFGIAVLPDDAAEPEQLLRKADRALYAAKARGRNRVEVAVSTSGPELGGDWPPVSDQTDE
ncbi:MAG: diguanylate cyclase [Solirubrobacteraceae bacterium]